VWTTLENWPPAPRLDRVRVVRLARIIATMESAGVIPPTDAQGC